jgi:chromate transporter
MPGVSVTPATRVPLRTVLRDWGRIGVIGFGGPPAHVVLLRELVVERHAWLDDEEFADANAACGLLPGPASTQLAIFCAQRVAGLPGAIVGGLAFILPGLVLLIALAAVSLQQAPPDWIRGLAAGAGAAVVAAVVHAGIELGRGAIGDLRGRRLTRAVVYVGTAATATVLVGPWVVLALLGCGLVELALQRGVPREGLAAVGFPGAVLLATTGVAALPGLAWMSLKVGALSYGGGFVIVPLMQADAVDVYGWMSDADFLNAVALGQLTPGPVTQTVAAVGYAAAGLGGALFAAALAFLPSFLIVGLGGDRFARVRSSAGARAFLDGAGPAAIGAILGAAVPLAAGIAETWQAAIAVTAAVALLGARLGVVPVLLGSAALGALVALAGGPLPPLG